MDHSLHHFVTTKDRRFLWLTHISSVGRMTEQCSLYRTILELFKSQHLSIDTEHLFDNQESVCVCEKNRKRYASTAT